MARTGSSTITQLIHDSFMDGFVEGIGTVEWGPGHYIFMPVAGQYYSLRTDSDGFVHLQHYPTAAAYQAAQYNVNTYYAGSAYSV